MGNTRGVGKHRSLQGHLWGSGYLGVEGYGFFGMYVGMPKAWGSPKGDVCRLEPPRHGPGDSMAPRGCRTQGRAWATWLCSEGPWEPRTLSSCAGHSAVAAGWAGDRAPRPLRARTLALTRTALGGRNGKPSLVSRPPPSAGPPLAPSLRCPCRPPLPKPPPPTCSAPGTTYPPSSRCPHAGAVRAACRDL